MATETTRPGSLDDTGIPFVDDANSYDADVGTYARAQGGSDGMSIAIWPEAGETQWEAPEHQAGYESALVVVKLETAGFVGGKEEWRLRFSENDGVGYSDIEAWNSVNAVDEYSLVLTDPTGQTWDDMVVRLEVQVVGGPPSTVTIDAYDVRVDATYAPGQVPYILLLEGAQ